MKLPVTTESFFESMKNVELVGRVADLALDVPLEVQGVDSLDQASFFLGIEDNYKLKISDEDYLNLKTVRQVIDYLNVRLGGNAS